MRDRILGKKVNRSEVVEGNRVVSAWGFSTESTRCESKLRRASVLNRYGHQRHARNQHVCSSQSHCLLVDTTCEQLFAVSHKCICMESDIGWSISCTAFVRELVDSKSTLVVEYGALETSSFTHLHSSLPLLCCLECLVSPCTSAVLKGDMSWPMRVFVNDFSFTSAEPLLVGMGVVPELFSFLGHRRQLGQSSRLLTASVCCHAQLWPSSTKCFNSSTRVEGPSC